MSKRCYTFDDVVGHAKILNLLKRQLDEDNVQDVILFYGGPGLGKSSVAKILAVELVARHLNDKSLIDDYRKKVIDLNQSCDAIKVFSMAEVGEKEDSINEVVANLTLGFSSCRIKVILIDEAQRMTKKAQDAILVDLEHLPKGVFVFFMTTEITALQETIVQRCRTPFMFNNLSDKEIRRLIRDEIDRKRLRFDMHTETVLSMMTFYSKNSPRNAYNLLGNFSDGSVVRADELSVFMNVGQSTQIIEIVKYLYGSLVLGVEYLTDFKFDTTFTDVLIEVSKVVAGSTSKLVSVEDTIFLREFMQGKDVKNFLKFTAEVCKENTMRRHQIVSAFMRSHESFTKRAAPDKEQLFRTADLATLEQTNKSITVNVGTQMDERARPQPSLSEWFSGKSNVSL